MIKKIFFALLVGAAIIAAIAIREKHKLEERRKARIITNFRDSASENVQVLEDFITIDFLGKPRTIRLYLPPNYNQDSSLYYPVMYFFDGQALFNEKVHREHEWEVDEFIDERVAAGQKGAIIVGIDNNANRSLEYDPFPQSNIEAEGEAYGADFGRFIVEQLKPKIDANYRTLPDAANTTIGGPSFGGMMTYYMIMTYPEVFGNAMSLSPSFWVSDLVWELHKNEKDYAQTKIYFNSGEYEGSDMIKNIKKARKLLIERGVNADNLRFDIVKDKGHYHFTWREGFKKAYPWIIG